MSTMGMEEQRESEGEAEHLDQDCFGGVILMTGCDQYFVQFKKLFRQSKVSIWKDTYKIIR